MSRSAVLNKSIPRYGRSNPTFFSYIRLIGLHLTLFILILSQASLFAEEIEHFNRSQIISVKDREPFGEGDLFVGDDFVDYDAIDDDGHLKNARQTPDGHFILSSIKEGANVLVMLLPGSDQWPVDCLVPRTGQDLKGLLALVLEQCGEGLYGSPGCCLLSADIVRSFHEDLEAEEALMQKEGEYQGFRLEHIVAQQSKGGHDDWDLALTLRDLTTPPEGQAFEPVVIQAYPVDGKGRSRKKLRAKRPPQKRFRKSGDTEANAGVHRYRLSGANSLTEGQAYHFTGVGELRGQSTPREGQAFPVDGEARPRRILRAKRSIQRPGPSEDTEANAGVYQYQFSPAYVGRGQVYRFTGAETGSSNSDDSLSEGESDYDDFDGFLSGDEVEAVDNNFYQLSEEGGGNHFHDIHERVGCAQCEAEMDSPDSQTALASGIDALGLGISMVELSGALPDSFPIMESTPVAPLDSARCHERPN